MTTVPAKMLPIACAGYARGLPIYPDIWVQSNVSGIRESPVKPPKSWLTMTESGLIQVAKANTLRKGAM